MHLECIAPPGSHRGNHRQDQSALSVLLLTTLFPDAPWKGWFSYGAVSMDHNRGDTAVINGHEVPMQEHYPGDCVESLRPPACSEELARAISRCEAQSILMLPRSSIPGKATTTTHT